MKRTFKPLVGLILMIAVLVIAAGCKKEPADTRLSDAYNETRIIFGENQSANNVTGDIQLVNPTNPDVAVNWISSNTNIISTSGLVTRPAIGQSDVNVVITASLTLEDQVEVKTFNLKVIARPMKFVTSNVLEFRTDFLHNQVATIEGLTVHSVIANGFYLTDGEALLFVFTNLTPSVNVGDVVNVDGQKAIVDGMHRMQGGSTRALSITPSTAAPKTLVGNNATIAQMLNDAATDTLSAHRFYRLTAKVHVEGEGITNTYLILPSYSGTIMNPNGGYLTPNVLMVHPASNLEVLRQSDGLEVYLDVIVHRFNQTEGLWSVVFTGSSADVITSPTVSLSNVTFGQEFVNFAINTQDPDGVIVSSKVELFRGSSLIQTINNASVTQFTNLWSNTNYSVVVTHTYNFNDGQGTRTVSANQTFRTLSKATPAVSITQVALTDTGVTFNYQLTDIDATVEQLTFDLLLDGVVVETLQSTQVLRFDALLSGSDYQIRANLLYNLDDGTGQKPKSVFVEFSTPFVVEPTAEVILLNATGNTVEFDLHLEDLENLIQINGIALFFGGVLVETLLEMDELLFENLNYYRDYEIVLYYEFDLGDGRGVQEREATLAFKTLPETPSIQNIHVLEAFDRFRGSVNVRIDVTNPSDATLFGVVSEGLYYQAEIGSTPQALFISPVTLAMFGGDMLTISHLIYLHNGELYFYEVSSNNEKALDVYHPLTVLDVRVTTGEYYLLGDGTQTIDVELYNPAGVLIEAVEFGGVTYVVPEDPLNPTEPVLDVFGSTLRLYIENDYGLYTDALTSITYLSGVSRTKVYENIALTYYVLASSTVNVISTPMDLLHLKEGEINQLGANINLSNTLWSTQDFNGVLLGNGYTISGLNLYSVDHSGETHVAMFNQNLGVISQLTLENVRIIAQDSKELTLSTLAVVNEGIISGVYLQGELAVTIQGSDLTTNVNVSGLVNENHGILNSNLTSMMITVMVNTINSQVNLFVSGGVNQNTGTVSADYYETYTHVTVQSINATLAVSVVGAANTNEGNIHYIHTAGEIHLSGNNPSSTLTLDVAGSVGMNQGKYVANFSDVDLLVNVDAAILNARVAGSVVENSGTMVHAQNAGRIDLTTSSVGNVIVAGVTALNQGIIKYGRQDGMVHIESDTLIFGGVTGINQGRVESSQASGSATLHAYSIAGGLIGINHKDAMSLYAAVVFNEGIEGIVGTQIGRDLGFSALLQTGVNPILYPLIGE